MPTEKALEILDDCKAIGVQAVQFTGGGEPTIHPEFLSIVRATADSGLLFSLVSNGVRIDSEHADVVSKASWVRISLDAAKQETYCRIRRCPEWHWKRATEAVRLLRDARDKNGTGCVLGVGFVVTPDNWKEVADAAELAKSLGADNFRISAEFTQQDEKLFDSFALQADELCRKAEGLTDVSFCVFNRFHERLGDLQAHNPLDRLCGYQFFTTYIGADLGVYRCCGYAYNDHGFVGSLKNQRFKDFWMSQARFDNQWNFDARGCERCQFRAQNQALAYALEPQLHEEFV